MACWGSMVMGTPHITNKYIDVTLKSHVANGNISYTLHNTNENPTCTKQTVLY